MKTLIAEPLRVATVIGLLVTAALSVRPVGTSIEAQWLTAGTVFLCGFSAALTLMPWMSTTEKQ